MSRRRYISTEISVDRKVGLLGAQGGDFAVLLYTWMIPHASDQGVLTGDPGELLAIVVPMRRDKDEEDVSAALGAMDRLGLIEWQPGSDVLFPADSFYRHQSYVKVENRRPAAETGAQQRESAENSASVSLPISPSISITSSIPPPPPSEAAAAADEDAVTRLIRVWEHSTGALVTPVFGERCEDELREGTPEDWIADVFRETGVQGKNSPKYAWAILDRWKREGRGGRDPTRIDDSFDERKARYMPPGGIEERIAAWKQAKEATT